MPAPASVAAPLLERGQELAVLHEQLSEVLSGRGGRVVLVGGEAGIGKTALVRRFCEDAASRSRVLAGACDALFTPRPLGPLLDIAGQLGGPLASLLADGGRPHEVCRTLLDEARSARRAVVVLEDIHWADEATLDVVRILARRVAAAPALVLVTFRDDGLARDHPLRVLLGELPAGDAVIRIHLAPLSRESVVEMARARGIDPSELYARTGGNPFFVTEVIAADGCSIPAHVRDAVLARAARLSARARRVIDAVSAVPPVAEPWLLEALGVADADALEECLSSGMLIAAADGVAFRHELARVAIAEALNPLRLRELHRGALAGLTSAPAGNADITRLAHHAEGASDRHAVLRQAPAAGALAAARGAHREAAAQYARAIRFAGAEDDGRRAELLLAHAHEAYLTDDFDAAAASGREAVECFRRSGDRLREADGLRRLAQHLRCAGIVEEGHAAADASLRILQALPPTPELAFSLAVRAFLAMNNGDPAVTFEAGHRAIETAQRTNATRALLHALNTVGTMELMTGAKEGAEKLSRSLELARTLDLDEEIGRAYLNFALAASSVRAYAPLSAWLAEGLDYCSERGLELWRHYLLGYRARMLLELGRWDEAVEAAGQVLRATAFSLSRIDPLLVVALVRARRGDPDWGAPLDEARDRGAATGELQFVAPVALAEAEIAWLHGRVGDIGRVTDHALELALRGRARWWTAHVAVWRRRAGLDERIDDADVAGPSRLELADEPVAASRGWRELGCPYEAALALQSAADDEQAGTAHDDLVGLGARMAASVVARRLRSRGVAGIRRGPRAATRANAAGLTRRECEVLAMLRGGLTNATIAGHLHLSQRTVDHHVSALLSKLGARTRNEAIDRAAQLGVDA